MLIMMVILSAAGCEVIGDAIVERDRNVRCGVEHRAKDASDRSHLSPSVESMSPSFMACMAAPARLDTASLV